MAQFAASIAAHGILQNFRVHPIEGDRFGVVIGGTRLDALRLLLKQKKIGADYAVPCDVRPADDPTLTEASLAENVIREAMHPADEFDAFKRLADDGQGPEAIAARFVGLAKYEQAGGGILRDLFDEKGEGWLTDLALLNELAAEKLEVAAAPLRSDGWKGVEVAPALDWQQTQKDGHIAPPCFCHAGAAGGDRQASDAIMKEHGEESQDEAAYDRLADLQETIAERFLPTVPPP